MITDRKLLKQYIKADYLANDYSFKVLIAQFFVGDNKFAFLKNLRKLEYAINTKKNKFLVFFYRFIHRRKSLKFNVVIPPNTFGKGLRIPHLTSIVVSGNAKIGDNCNIHQGCTIGNDGKTDDSAAIIGDNCYLGANVVVVGKLKIGNNVKIGAGSVVTKDVEDDDIVVGVPARSIKIKGA